MFDFCCFSIWYLKQKLHALFGIFWHHVCKIIFKLKQDEKIAVLFFAIFSLTTILFAQGEKKSKLSVEERVTKQITHIQSVTGCSTDQVDKIKVAATTKFTKIEEVHAKYKGQKDKKEVMKSEVQPIRKAFREELNYKIRYFGNE